MARPIFFAVLLTLAVLSSANMYQVIHVQKKLTDFSPLINMYSSVDDVYSLVIDDAEDIEKEKNFFNDSKVITRFDDGSLICADKPAAGMRREDKDFNKDADEGCNKNLYTDKCDGDCNKCAIKSFENTSNNPSQELQNYANKYYRLLYKGLGIKLVEKMIENIINYETNKKSLYVYTGHLTTLRAFAGTVLDVKNINMIMDNNTAFVMKYDKDKDNVVVYIYNETLNASQMKFDNKDKTDHVNLKELTRISQENKADLCSSNKDGVKEMKCDVKDEKPSTVCLSYRRNCWETACPQNSILNADTYICEGVKAESKMPTSSAGAMAACTMLGGVLVGAGMMFAIQFYKSKR